MKSELVNGLSATQQDPLDVKDCILKKVSNFLGYNIFSSLLYDI